MSEDRPARPGGPSSGVLRMRFGAQGGRAEPEARPTNVGPPSRFDDDEFDDEPFEQAAVYDRSGKLRAGTGADVAGKLQGAGRTDDAGKTEVTGKSERSFEHKSERKSAFGGRAGATGFGSSRRKPADDGGFSRSSERATRSRSAPQAETVDADGYTRSSQQVQPRKSPRPDGPSLKMRAADYLSRREHSRMELARKLARWSDDRDEVEAVLDALTREGWMSTERFVQSVVHRRASRQGTSRIIQELRQHGIDSAEIEAVKPELQASEFTRAREVWVKRFGGTPPDREGWAKHARFLAARGFSHDVIRRVLGGEGADEDI